MAVGAEQENATPSEELRLYESGSDLVEVITAWDDLPHLVKAKILELVRT